jgi:hypothetical protein
MAIGGTDRRRSEVAEMRTAVLLAEYKQLK